ncbi:MAG: hypothetical protein R6U89_05040 [Dehalococcoidia bacterium]
MLFRLRSIILILLVSLLTVPMIGMFSLVTKSADAQSQSIDIIEFSISTKQGTYDPGDPLVAGVSYQIEFTLDIATGVNDTVILKTSFDRSGDRYWELVNEEYAGVDLDNWQPSQSEIHFDAVAGEATFILNGAVPEGYTSTELENGQVLHMPDSIIVLDLALQEGGALDMREVEVIDESIQAYRKALSARQNLLDTTETLPEYASLIDSIISQAKEEADRGYTELATSLLESIPSMGWPEPADDSESSTAYLYIIMGVIAVIAVAAIIFIIRSRSTLSFLKQRADDQANKLDIVESRVQRLGEKSLSGEIAQVRDTLRSMGRR